MAVPVQITLNPSGVVAPALTALQTTLEAVAICFHAIENAQAVPQLSNGFFQLRFEPLVLDARKPVYKDWLLAKGFHDLAKGIRLSLEEAYLYVELPKHQGLTTWGELQARVAAIKKRANEDLSFPDLMRAVNNGLTKKLHFEQEFISLQKIRNCLEHRNAMVGERDVEKSTGILTLTLPWMKVFYMKDGVETELAVGDRFEKETQILISPKRVTEVARYKLGDRISFTPEKFERIAYACWLFAQELGGKLPRLPPPDKPAT